MRTTGNGEMASTSFEIYIIGSKKLHPWLAKKNIVLIHFLRSAVFMGDSYLFHLDRSTWANLTGPIAGSLPLPRINHGFAKTDTGVIYGFGGVQLAGKFVPSTGESHSVESVFQTSYRSH